MIKLTKLNGKEMLVNAEQIEYIESIPESKIVMMNGEYLLATESIDLIIEKVAEYRKRCFSPDMRSIREDLVTVFNQMKTD